jgi:hypothetical protein
MYFELYIEKASVKAYIPDDQNATRKNTVKPLLALSPHLRQVTPMSPRPLLHFLRGGRFTRDIDDSSENRDQWIVFRGTPQKILEKNLKDLTRVMLVFAVVYFLATLVLLLR